jgi:ABC-type transport system involved in multi-copper enzyme maturation permease subunit
MMAFLRSIRDQFEGEVTGRLFPNRLALAAVAVIGAALVFAASWLPPLAQVVLWGTLLAVLLAVSRPFGPVLFYDLVRSARRTRFTVIRTLYASLMAFILGWIFMIITFKYDGKVPSREMTEIATWIFNALIAIQFITVVLLTPAYTAGAIAEEKERKTLEFILGTDLRNGEIISGKVASRLLNLALLLLAGVPIFSLLQFLGGVDFYLVMAGAAATLVTMFSLAGLSILNSVSCRRARDAIVLTFLMGVAYYILATASLMVYPLSRSQAIPGLEHFPSTDSWTSPVELGDVVDWFNAGNIGYAVFRLGRGASATAVLENDLPGVLGAYALFHGLVGVVCIGWSVMRLRILALRETVKAASRKKGMARRVPNRPRVGRHPMIWKEVFAEGAVRLNAMGRVVVLVLVLASFIPTIIIIYLYFEGRFRWGMGMAWKEVGEAMNAAQMRFVATTVATLMLLLVVVRAAGSVRNERERNTFDELLTTPLTNDEILFAKWFGSVLSVRWGWAWLGLIWAVCLVTGGVEVFGPPLILVSWLVYAAVGAGVGLWFSIGSRSTLRATVAALATMIVLYGGHWLLTGLFCYMPIAILFPRMNDNSWDWMLYLQGGQTPPFVMGLFAYGGRDFEHHGFRHDEWLIKITLASLFGVLCWAGLVPLLWVMIKRRFEEVTGRAARTHPERITPRARRPVTAPKRALVIDAKPAGNGQDERILTVLPVDEKEPDVKGQPPA